MSLIRDLVDSFKVMAQLNRECRLYFYGIIFNGISQGIFTVIFNLYILSLGISTDTLGLILSVAPIAQMLGSIPVGLLMESIGYKKTFILVYGISGIARLLQVVVPSVPLISVAAFVGGLALSGDFVVRLPFLSANTTPEQRTHVFSLSAIVFSTTIAIGALLAGYVPTFFQWLGMNTTQGYQLLLVIAGVLSVLGALPLLQLKSTPPLVESHKISLAPYLHGIDRFTLQQAAISLFVGIGVGLTSPFMNIYFLFHLSASREYFGVISALAIIPTLLAVTIAPVLARKTGNVRAVTILRFIIPFFMINLAFTTLAWSGTLSYWIMSAMTTASQPLSFAFALWAARKSAKAATSAWLNVTFWLGMAASAPLAGMFLSKADYKTPLFIAAAAMLAASLLNDFFFKRVDQPGFNVDPIEV
ncbi:MAG: MFS transporter [Chloroflexota bacterium]